MIRGLVFCLLGLIIIHSGSVDSKAKPSQVGDRNKSVERAESHPNLTVKFDGVAQLKLASRKSTFHLGEMITLDIALLNASSRSLFFRKLSELQVKAVNSAGQPLMVQAYGVADRALVPGSFVRLAPGEIIVHSFQLLAGCDKRAFAQIASTKDDDLTVFKNGLFLSWGDACLPITQPDTYTFSVETKNDFVLLSPRTGNVRTAVGTIKSNSLEMIIGN